MTEIFPEMTQGDAYHEEIAFIDEYGASKDMTGWDIEVTFRSSFGGVTLVATSLANDGIAFENDDPTTGIVYLRFAANAVADLCPGAIDGGCLWSSKVSDLWPVDPDG